jgi:hypothetical protein
MTHQPFKDARYTTLQDFSEAVALPCLVPSNKAYQDRFTTETFGHDWLGAGCDTGQDVARLVHDGWPAGRERLNTFASKIESPLQPVDRRRRVIRGGSGDSLDMPTVWSGRLDMAWRAPRRITSLAPARVDIVANMLCSGGDHSDVLFWRGAAAVAVADLLEQAGYMVRLSVVFGGKTGDGGAHDKCSCRIVVKDHGMPLDVTSTSAVILPGFFRALGHAWISNHATARRQMSGIYVGQGIIEPGEILASHTIFDHATALAFVVDTITALNDGRAAA